MQLVSSSDISTNTLPINFQQELVAVFTQSELQSIEEKCHQIDIEDNKVKFSIIAIGRHLLEISTELKKACETAGIAFTPVFETFIKDRFNRKVNWAWQHIQVFQRFSPDEPLLGVVSIMSLCKLAKLDDEKIGQFKQRLLEHPVKLNRNDVNDLIDSIATGNEKVIISAMDEDAIAEISDKNASLEKTLKQVSEEKLILERDLELKTQANQGLIDRMQQAQEEMKNLSAALAKDRQELTKLTKQVDDDKKNSDKSKKPANHLDVVETDKIPDGYTSIVEAIEDKERALREITERFNEAQSLLLDEEAIQNELEELHELYSDLQIRQLSIINKARPSDIKQRKDIVNKIVAMAEELKNSLQLQIA